MNGRARLLPEILLAAAVLASLAWTVSFFVARGYLPSPFVFDTNDTFMDWFNTAYWANNPGAYDVWRTIYPPLSFVFLDMFSLQGCYLDSPFHARDCDWLGRATIYSFYVIDVVLVWLVMRRVDRATAPMRTIALGLGLPLLFTLERGNLIVVGFACFVLAHGPLLQSRWLRALAGAATINFKPYLVLPMLADAVKRDWRPLEIAGIATILLYLLTLALVGAGTPGEIVSNTANWVVFQSGQVWNEINYSTSYAPLMLVENAPIPLLQFVSSETVDTIILVASSVIRSTQVIALIALLAAWVQPGAVSRERIAALLLGAYLVTQSPGGYTQVFLLFLVFLEPWRRPGPIVAIICGYLLCLVGDWSISTVLELSTPSWLSGRPVEPAFGLTMGHFLRPGIIALLVWGLSVDTIMQSLRAHRTNRPVLGLKGAQA